MFVLSVSVIGAKICTEQRCVYEIPQGPSNTEAYTRHIGRQWEGGEHGGMAQGEFDMFIICVVIANLIIGKWKKVLSCYLRKLRNILDERLIMKGFRFEYL